MQAAPSGLANPAAQHGHTCLAPADKEEGSQAPLEPTAQARHYAWPLRALCLAPAGKEGNVRELLYPVLQVGLLWQLDANPDAAVSRWRLLKRACSRWGYLRAGTLKAALMRASDAAAPQAREEHTLGAAVSVKAAGTAPPEDSPAVESVSNWLAMPQQA